jgi:hypothetical protein
MSLAVNTTMTNHLMWTESWILATIIGKIVLGTIYVSYFFSVVLYPYARFKASDIQE